MKNLKILLTILLFGLLLASCSGDDGAPGINGVDGADGADGNANIIASGWFDPTWAVPSTMADFTHDAPEITQEVLDTGLVMVYSKMYGSVYPLPISFMGDSNPKEFDFWITLGSVRIWFTAESSYTPDATTQFRYVIIPSGTSGSKSISSREGILADLETAGVDIYDYSSVCQHFGLDF